jgi:hypothetical protein
MYIYQQNALQCLVYNLDIVIKYITNFEVLLVGYLTYITGLGHFAVCAGCKQFGVHPQFAQIIQLRSFLLYELT